MDKISKSHPISFLRYQTKCAIKFFLIQLMASQTLRFFLDQLLKQWLTGRKRGEKKNTIASLGFTVPYLNLAPPKFKACVHYFLTNFYLTPNVSPSKTVKDVFYFI